jgi:hypothetical protein
MDFLQTSVYQHFLFLKLLPLCYVFYVKRVPKICKNSLLHTCKFVYSYRNCTATVLKLRSVVGFLFMMPLLLLNSKFIRLINCHFCVTVLLFLFQVHRTKRTVYDVQPERRRENNRRKARLCARQNI